MASATPLRGLSPTPVNKSDACQLLLLLIRKEPSANENIMSLDSLKETHSSWLLDGILESESRNLGLSLGFFYKQTLIKSYKPACASLSPSDNGNLKKKKKSHHLSHVSYGFTMSVP